MSDQLKLHWKSESGNIYTINIYDVSDWDCNCKGYFYTKHCKHIRDAKKKVAKALGKC